MQKRVIIILFVLFTTIITNAQIYTISGHIKNLVNNPVAGLTVTLNTPGAETAITDAQGFFTLNTADYPTAINTIPESFELNVYPNPAKNTAIISLPAREGELSIYSITGQLVERIEIENRKLISIQNPDKMLVVKYRKGKGNFESKKLLVESKSLTLFVQHSNYLKSAEQDTFSYKLNINGTVNENVIDTTVNITGFAKTETSHEQDFVINTKQIFVNAKTISIGKVADKRNYNVNDESYIDSRLIGGIDVAITNSDGSFYVTKKSGENGEIPQFEVPEQGSYFYIIEPGKTHQAVIKFDVEKEENEEIFSAADLEMSVWNALQVHLRYDNGNGASTLTPRSDGMNKTRNWKPEYLEPGVMNHLIETNIWDDNTSGWVDEIITQEQIDTILNTRNSSDIVLNDFYKNGNTVLVDKDTRTNYSINGKTDLFYFKNDRAAGTFGIVERNGVAYSAEIGVNIDNWNDGTTNFGRALIQENISVKGFGELQNADKLSTFDASKSPTYITDDTKRSLEWYQIRSQMLADDGVPEKGIWGWDIDQRVMEEANTNPYIQNFINSHGTTEAINEFNKYVSGEKSAELKSAKDEYTMTVGTIDVDGSVTKKIITEDNFKDALVDKDISNFYKQEIKSLFE